MQRTTFSLLLVAPLIIAACTTETSDRPDQAVRAAATEVDPGTAGEGAEPDANNATVDTPNEAGSDADATDPNPAEAAAAVAPKRTPTFGFQPGGDIPDEALNDYYVELSASVDGEDVGTMTISVWGDKAPITVRNFLRLADEGFYDGLTFHRIMRDFMVQGGDPTGTGGGNSPYGTIKAEFSPDPDRGHDYGVLSMARLGGNVDSASCQFFICCDPGSVKSLDGQYATFGRITSGVETLEALANVQCAGREGSSPTVPVLITKAEVNKGAAPTGEEIKRPPIDLGGEPEHIVVQHILVSFAGTGVPATRTQEEAEQLAGELLAMVQGGEDFETILLANTDEPVQEGDTTPGVYRLLNSGIRNPEAEEGMKALGQVYQTAMQDIQAKQASGELTPEQAQEETAALRADTMARADELQWRRRAESVPGFGDVAFKLEVGEIGMAGYDPKSSPFGWHIIRRLE